MPPEKIRKLPSSRIGFEPEFFYHSIHSVDYSSIFVLFSVVKRSRWDNGLKMRGEPDVNQTSSPFFSSLPSSQLGSHALPLSNPPAQGLLLFIYMYFVTHLNSLSYQKKREQKKKKMKDGKKNNFRESHSFGCGGGCYFFFLLLFLLLLLLFVFFPPLPNLPCPSSSIAFPCVIRLHQRGIDSHSHPWQCNNSHVNN